MSVECLLKVHKIEEESFKDNEKAVQCCCKETPLIIFFCGWLQKMHVFLNRVRKGLSMSPKVVDLNDFGTKQKRLCNLLINSNNYSHRRSPEFCLEGA